MLVTSFKTQASLLMNPLDFSLDFTKNFKEFFKSYIVVFKTYNFSRYILTSTIVSVGTVAITLYLLYLRLCCSEIKFFVKPSLNINYIYLNNLIIYTIFSQLGLRNSISSLLIVYTATTLQWLFTSRNLRVPKEIEMQL